MENFKELFSAFDYIDEVIYICDMDNYDLIYCNKKLEEILDAAFGNTRPGSKCYQCLQGLDSPCVFCNNDELRKKRHCSWSRLNSQTDKYYLIHDEILTVGGKEYRMELAVDATHLEDAAAYTRQKLEMESHLTDCVRYLVKSDSFSEAVSAVLQTVLNYFGGERAYMFEFNWEEGTSRNTYEICAPGVTPEIDNLQSVPLEHMSIWTDIFLKKENLIIPNMEALKDDPERRNEYNDLSIQGIRSLVAVPVYTDDKLTGFVGVDNPSINFANIDFLVDLAYFLGVEIRKTHIFKELVDQSTRDALTDVYNRKGFEEITGKLENVSQSIGFLLVDVDNFKMINDNYGHSMGDEILQKTADLLKGVFRSEDAVFRLGGDEFAVLLMNCDADAWKTICSKIQWVHASLFEIYKKMSVTLSGGLCFAKGHYNDQVYQLADDALYSTKKNGRAGCTMIDEATGEKHYWKDDSLSSYSRAVLNYNNTGLYRTEYPADEQVPPRMICSNDVREMFAFPADADAETCYRLWREGIEPSYIEVVDAARKQMLENVQTECTYKWNHPKFGQIYVRSIGVGEIETDVRSIQGYHHSMRGTGIIEKKDESHLLLEAISSIYFGSYYIDLDKDNYTTIKYAPNERFLQVQERDAQQSLYNFISVLAHRSDHEKMNRFVDLATLSKRMENETHLDCEYYAVKEEKWCRATFIPVRYHDDGRLSRVLFEVAPLDFNRSMEADENAKNKKTIESLYNHVPGGLVMYEWDGKKLKTVHISRYYEQLYGESMVSRDGDNIGGPDFRRVHPDDLKSYREAIYKALTDTHELEYIYRGWNNIKNRYDWIKINAVSEVQEDGTSLVYAMYSDVSAQKEAEIELQKKHVSLMAALEASNQLCFEYDPVTRTEECLTEDNVFHLPRYIENYPEKMKQIIHPDDWQTFSKVLREMESGKAEDSCSIRLLRAGKYVWYAYQFRSLYDAERGRSIISISIMDDTEHMEVIHNYQARMKMIMGLTEEAVSFGTINLTQNTFEVIRAGKEMHAIADHVKSVDDLFQNTVKLVVGSKEQQEYAALFNCENLIDQMKKGRMHVHMDHMYHVSDQQVEWVRTCVDMLHNPSSGDTVGVAYSKSIQKEKLFAMLLEKTLRRDYPMAAIIETKSDRYYIYDAGSDEYGVSRESFWSNIEKNLLKVIDASTALQVFPKLQKAYVLKGLDSDGIYAYSFNGRLGGEIRRIESWFCYMDDSHEMILATLRDITDSVIMEQLRHDNERDHLTNLYNRRKVFAVCEEMMREHPDEQFAMLHFDIRHFRLYNTFFGDVAGDKLLCDIADMFRNMDKDYEYWVYGRIESDVFCVFFPIWQNKYQKHLDDLLHGLQDYRSDFLIEPAIGIYTVEDRSMSIESMFTRASIAAKTVRSGVTNAVIFYDEEMERTLLDEQQVVNDMQTAIEQEQFQVYLQPQFSLENGKPVGAEALVRWMHPQKGMITPDKYIPVFERNGFIANLDRYMWEHVCRLLRKWLDRGYPVMPVSVNVSRISMYSPTTVQFLKDLVDKYGLEPRYLELELTESAYMDDPSEIKKQLKELRKYGFHIFMDDFGSGYSSLNTLRELPVDCLKLDREFLSQSTTDERGRLVLTSVVSMGKLLNLCIIAEGVETKEQRDFLRGIGCDYVQGFLLARPMPAPEYEERFVAVSE